MNRGYYVAFRRRPNDKMRFILDLSVAMTEAASNAPSLVAVAGLQPKELQRLLWVTIAPAELRARSESYWERYYTNICCSVSIIAGGSLATIVLLGDNSSPFRSGNTADIWFLGARLLVAALVAATLLWVSRGYRPISTALEESWTSALVSLSRRDRRKVLRSAVLPRGLLGSRN